MGNAVVHWMVIFNHQIEMAPSTTESRALILCNVIVMIAFAHFGAKTPNIIVHAVRYTALGYQIHKPLNHTCATTKIIFTQTNQIKAKKLWFAFDLCNDFKIYVRAACRYAISFLCVFSSAFHAHIIRRIFNDFDVFNDLNDFSNKVSFSLHLVFVPSFGVAGFFHLLILCL